MKNEKLPNKTIENNSPDRVANTIGEGTTIVYVRDSPNAQISVYKEKEKVGIFSRIINEIVIPYLKKILNV